MFEVRKDLVVCGILACVCVSRYRNASEQVFGFVCFTNVRNVDKLNKALNKVYFGQQQIWANVARFNRFGGVGTTMTEMEEAVRE